MIIYNPEYTYEMGGMMIDHSGNWDCNVAPTMHQGDMQTIILHELGHAHFLDHVASKLKVMYPSITSGEERSVLHGDDIAGGKNVVNYSAANCPSDCDATKLLPASGCTTGTYEHENTIIQAIITPNPAYDMVKVTLTEFPDLEFVDVSISTLLGQSINRSSMKVENRELKISLPSTMPAGVYLINISANNHRSVGKVVKM
jgi:Secretion system C-terminal sorting domain/Matrixin